jgi:hypothetical protein
MPPSAPVIERDTELRQVAFGRECIAAGLGDMNVIITEVAVARHTNRVRHGSGSNAHRAERSSWW